MHLDHTVYPELQHPPEHLATPEAKADYVHRVCSAFDFGVAPERSDWDLFRGWKAIFDDYPLPHSPAYHTFRARFGWPAVARGVSGLVPPWKTQDLREGRTDPCERAV